MFYYLNSRYYNPNWCRFINADDVAFIGLTGTPLSGNIFAYCENNPVINSDPSGEILISTCVLIGIGIGALIGGTVGYTVAKSKGYKVKSWGFWGCILGGVIIGGTVGGVLGYVGGAWFGASGIKAGSLASKISMTKVRRLGQLGEHLAKISKNTSRIESLTKTAKYRIPDILSHADKIIGDVKYVKSLSYTAQLKDFYLYAQKMGYTYILMVKPDTKLSSTLLPRFI